MRPAVGFTTGGHHNACCSCARAGAAQAPSKGSRQQQCEAAPGGGRPLRRGAALGICGAEVALQCPARPNPQRRQRPGVGEAAVWRLSGWKVSHINGGASSVLDHKRRLAVSEEY